MIKLSNGMIFNQVEIVAIIQCMSGGWTVHFKSGIYVVIADDLKQELEGVLK